MLEVGIVIIIIILVVANSRLFARMRLSSVTLPNSHRKWQVITSYNNSTEAAELLQRIHNSMIEFMRFLRDKYHIDAPYDATNIHTRKYKMVDSLLNNYNPDVIYENDPQYSTSTSYTVNKGASTYICLRNKPDYNTLVDYDVLMFVLLHELSHIANYDGWGHEPDFWIAFKFILEEAAISGIYTPVDYSKHSAMYCGLNITYNPLYDNELPPV